jgi:beta-glucanase (GH16 family)
VKFDKNTGAHGSFWIQSTQANRPDYGPAEDGAEIDVIEYFGKAFNQGDVYSFIHYFAKGATKSTKVPAGPLTSARPLMANKDEWGDRYHVFSVEWTPTAYVFRIDGRTTLRLTSGVSRVPEFLILSMLSSGWELERMNRATLPNSTEVDWVRVWTKEPKFS